MAGAVIWQRLEGALVFAASIALFVHINDSFSWWMALLLFFAPDVSFVFYGLGPRIGALGYNTVHVYAFGLLLLAGGFLASMPTLAALGALWLAHSGFDRMLGYGLKLAEDFSQTHLGPIGSRKR